MRGGFPRANAVKHVKEKHGVNTSRTSALLTGQRSQPPWTTGARHTVAGVHELVANAMIMTGEKERETTLRGNHSREGGNE